MPVRQLLAVGLWLCVTASATAIVWAGTSTVAASLTDRPAPVVAHRDVVTALESGAPGPAGAKTAPGLTAPQAKTFPSTGPSGRPGSAVASPAPVQAPSASKTPTPSAGPASPAPSAAPPGGTSSPSTTQPPGGPTATYSTAGGVVTVECSNFFFIGLRSATPKNGYAVRVITPGPYYVEVHFVGAGQDVPIWAYCLGRPVRAYDGPPLPRGAGSS